MHSAEYVIALLAVATFLALIARRLTTPFPILLVLCGTAIGLVMGLVTDSPIAPLDPKLVFLLFLPPLLYSGAFLTHWPDFKASLRSILLLSVGLVFFTVTVTAVAAHYIAGLPWASAFVLGAIVSPPDAVAATAVMSRLRIPKKIVTILEGESLVNDASGLVAYKFAVLAVMTGSFSLATASWSFVLVSLASIAFGLAFAWLVVAMHRKLNDSGWVIEHRILITITLLSPYAAYLPAEHLQLSGVLAVVSAGFYIGSKAAQLFQKTLFTEARVVWEMVEFLLNSLIFILIGLQLPAVLRDLNSSGPVNLGTLLGQTLLVGAAVIVARIVWVFPGAYLPRYLSERIRARDPYPSWRGVTVVSWTGMRGVVSMAAALALPLTTNAGEPFPGRELIQFLTFGIIFMTLVGQGLTLPYLIEWLGVGLPAGATREPSPAAPPH